MDKLQVTVRFLIQDGKLDAFKEIAVRCMESVRTKDSGTLQYDWFISTDGTACVVRETYRDSAAVLEHSANLGELVPALVAISEPQIETFGAPTEELMDALSAFAPRVYPSFRSI